MVSLSLALTQSEFDFSVTFTDFLSVCLKIITSSAMALMGTTVIEEKKSLKYLCEIRFISFFKKSGNKPDSQTLMDI